MNRNEYRRALIMLRSLLNGYSGHARIEIRTLTGNLNIVASTPQNAQSVRAALVGKRRSEYFAYPLGTLRRDMRGQAGLTATFDPRDIGGRTLDAYSLLALVAVGDEKCELVLAGNLNGSCEMDWSRVRDTVCALYMPQPVYDMPDTDKNEAAITETAEETTGEAVENSEAEPNNSADAREGAYCPLEDRAADTEKAEDETERAQDAGADEGSDEGINWNFARETDENGANGAEEGEKAEERDTGNNAEEREDLSEPFRREGWTYARAALPAGCGYPYAYLGASTGGNEMCVALPAQFTPEPPAGLEDYDWFGGIESGWWVRCCPANRTSSETEKNPSGE